MMSLFISAGFALVLLLSLNAGSSQAQTLQGGYCGANSCRAGDCEQFPNGYMCHCFGAIKGPDCSVPLYIPPDNACGSNPCWGGGTCRVVSNNWVCDCPPGRLGKDCRTIDPAFVTLCPLNYCKNGGVCSLVDTKPSCNCAIGWTGQTCETVASGIQCNTGTNPCFNGATCNSTTSKCDCAFGYTGSFCQTFVQLPRYMTIKIKNLGWYVAGLELYYNDQDSQTGKKTAVAEKSSIAAVQEHVFRIPATASFESPEGVNLVAFAYLGKEIFNIRLYYQNELCIHVWGTTLINSWSRMDC